MGCNASKDANHVVEEDKKKEVPEIKILDLHQDNKNATPIKEQLQGISEENKESHEEVFREEEEKAATKIQAVFRGYQIRRKKIVVPEEHKNTITMSQDPSKAEMEAEFSADDKELCHAATKIQASFRGHQVRKQAEADKPAGGEESSSKNVDDEVLDIDLTDPELHKAATKIQASFRGHKKSGN